MANDSKDKNATKWNSTDEACLVHTLAQEKSKGNWDNNPKPVAWSACETALAGSEKVSGGGAKGVQAIKSRWQRLKQEYDVVKELHGLSGFGWDDARNMVTASEAVWKDYIEKHPKAKVWQKKPFPLYDDIAEIVDGTRATGENAFRASEMSLPGARATPNVPATPYTPMIDPVLEALSNNIRNTVTTTKELEVEAPAKFARKKCDKKTSDLDTSSDEENLDERRGKRMKGGRTTIHEHRKSKCVTAGEGLATVAESMQMAMSILARSLSERTADPSTRKAAAIAAIEEGEDLSENEFTRAVEMVMVNAEAANIYLAIKNPAARTRFLQAQLDKL